MFDQMIRRAALTMWKRIKARYSIGKAAETKYLEIRHVEYGQVIYMTFDQILDHMALHTTDQFLIELDGDARVRSLLSEHNPDYTALKIALTAAPSGARWPRGQEPQKQWPKNANLNQNPPQPTKGEDR